MRSIILAGVALLALLGNAEAKRAPSCTTDAECAKVDGDGGPRKRNAVTIRMCAAKWKEAKADEAVKEKGWPKFWSACAKEAKAARTLAP